MSNCPPPLEYRVAPTERYFEVPARATEDGWEYVGSASGLSLRVDIYAAPLDSRTGPVAFACTWGHGDWGLWQPFTADRLYHSWQGYRTAGRVEYAALAARVLLAAFALNVGGPATRQLGNELLLLLLADE